MNDWIACNKERTIKTVSFFSIFRSLFLSSLPSLVFRFSSNSFINKLATNVRNAFARVTNFICVVACAILNHLVANDWKHFNRHFVFVILFFFVLFAFVLTESLRKERKPLKLSNNLMWNKCINNMIARRHRWSSLWFEFVRGLCENHFILCWAFVIIFSCFTRTNLSVWICRSHRTKCNFHR